MSNRPKIVVNKSTPCAVEMFSAVGDVLALDSPEITAGAVRDADILIVRSETLVDRRLLEGSSVRFVGTVTIGTDHLDTQYLQSRQIPFVSAPGSNARSVAEYVCAGLLSVWKGELTGKTLGIVGVGHVGSLVAHMARALGIRVLLNDPPLARTARQSECVSLDDLMTADAVTIHVPLAKTGTDATYHLFDDARIKRMNRGSILINTSRGAVVDTKALLDALTSQQLSGAILDVWEDEPTISTDLLERVTIGTPHIAGYSLDGRLRAVEMVFDDVCKFLHIAPPLLPAKGETLHDVVLPPDISEMDAVRFAVASAYDIHTDDHMLRRAVEQPPAKRGIYFAHLRSEYRTRYEFKHWNIRATQAQRDSSRVLRELGFNVIDIS